MNVLIIDDDIYMIEDVKNSVNWDKLGIENIYTGNNIRKAKDIISCIPIHVMICDIEMPQGTGIELLEWVRENGYDIQNIFLTSFAEFEYARQAIALNSMEYLLKPINEQKLEASLEKAIMKAKSTLKESQYQKYGEYWLNSQKNIKEMLWHKILKKEVDLSEDALEKMATRQYFSDPPSVRFVPILLSMECLDDEVKKWEMAMLKFVLNNIMEEIFSAQEEMNLESMVTMSDMTWVAIFKSNLQLEDVPFEQYCKDFILNVNKIVKIDISVYVGTYGKRHLTTQVYEQLLEIKKNNVAARNQVFQLKNYHKKQVVYVIPNMDAWELLLYHNNKEKLFAQVKDFLVKMKSSSGIDLNTLNQLKVDFLQMVFSVLKQKQIHAHKLFADERSQRNYNNSTGSIPAMLDFINHAITKAVDYSKFAEESESVFGKVKQYIELNLDSEIIRDRIAEVVYLNPDYLSRIFKRETGMSLTQYILERRIIVARQLLEETEVPIYMISTKVGFASIAYFSKVFKRETGRTPNGYRRETKGTVLRVSGKDEVRM